MKTEVHVLLSEKKKLAVCGRTLDEGNNAYYTQSIEAGTCFHCLNLLGYSRTRIYAQKKANKFNKTTTGKKYITKEQRELRREITKITDDMSRLRKKYLILDTKRQNLIAKLRINGVEYNRKWKGLMQKKE